MRGLGGFGSGSNFRLPAQLCSRFTPLLRSKSLPQYSSS